MWPGLHAAERPDKIAFVMANSGVAVTYRELNDRSNQLAQLLLRRRAAVRRPRRDSHGEPARVLRGLLGRAAVRPALHVHQLALHRRGSRVHPRRLRRAGARDLGRVPRRSRPSSPTGCRRVTVRLMVGDQIVDGYEPYADARDRYPAEPLAEEIEGTPMLYSSGTTGRPKGIKYRITKEPVGSMPVEHGLAHGDLRHGRRLGVPVARAAVPLGAAVLLHEHDATRRHRGRAWSSSIPRTRCV